MAIGDTGLLGYNSAIGINEEIAYGTKVAEATAFLEFTSESMKKTFEVKPMETIMQSRDFSRAVQTGEQAGGSIEAPLNPMSDAIVYLIKQAMGGYVTTTAPVAGMYSHEVYTGDMETTNATTGADPVKSLTIQVAKGDVANSKVWDFHGCRVNQLTIKGEVGAHVALTAEIVAKAGTVSSDSLSSVILDTPPVMFHGVAIRIGDNITSVTAMTISDTIQGFEFTINNNLVSDAAAKGMGSKYLSVCPPTRREVTLKLTQRFDTITAYNRFIALTGMAIAINCDSGYSIGNAGGSSSSLTIKLGKVQFTGSMPEVGDVGIIQHELEGIALNPNTSTSFTCRLTINNTTVDYT